MDRQALIERLEKLTPLHKGAILIATLLIIGGAYWYLSLQKDREEMNTLKNEIAGMDQQIAKHEKIVADNLPRIEKELEIRLRQFRFAKQLLPESNEEKENLLASIEKLGRDEGLEFRLFVPGSEQKKEIYAQTGIQLELNGNFHNLIRFFSRMSGMDRLVSLENLSLNPLGGKQGADDGYIPLNAKSRILLYRALTDKEIAAKKASKKKK
ncbi:MAG: type 4a pilus biogenesis protein PilO [Desulfovibrionales bacterium]